MATPPALADQDPELLRALLAAHDLPCPVCSYNLRGLSKPVCPECAAPLHLRVGSDNLRLGPWLLAVIGLALALGFDGVVTVLMTMVLLFIDRPKSPAEFQLVFTVLGCFLFLALCALAGISLLVRRRPAWNRLPLRRQWALGAAIFIATGLVHALYGWMIARHR